MKKGYALEDLKWSLLQQGYLRVEVEKAISIIKEKQAKEIPRTPIKTEETVEEKVEMPIIEEKKGFFSRLFGK